jgi:excinuclease ABC subunit B
VNKSRHSGNRFKNRQLSALPSPFGTTHIPPMPKSPRDPAKHSKKDPARPTRAKAHRPDAPPADPTLERLLNPGIERGTAGMGSGTGLQPPPDNSFERRADRRSEHTARKSVVKGFDEAPQRGYVANAPLDINAELRKALGYDNDPSKPLIGADQAEL